MTGYGRSQGLVANRAVVVEIRSYNHRYQDVRLNLPRGWTALEVRSENLLRKRIRRGRIECSVKAASGATSLGKPSLDLDNAREYLRLYRELARELWKDFGTEEEPRLELIANSEGVVLLAEQVEDVESAWGELLNLIESALAGVDQMRLAEGEELTAEVQKHLEEFGQLIRQVRTLLPQEQAQMTQRMIDRVRLLAGQVEISEERIAQEIGILSERIDVTEELVRLDSHLGQFAKFLASQEPKGRELDFLLQEMMRESNTLLSKMHSTAVVNLGVSLKAEIEKIRELIQNVE